MKKRKINITGLILLFVGTVLAGSLLSVIYFIIEPFVSSWSVQLTAILVILFGLGAGAASAVMIKFFKIRTPKQAIAVVAIGCLAFSYFKWALYVSNDAEYHLDNHLWESYLLSLNFTDENDVLYDEPQLREILGQMQNTTAFDYLGEEMWTEWNDGSLSNDDIAELKEYTYYEYFDYDYSLGQHIDDAVLALNRIFANPLGDLPPSNISYYEDLNESEELPSVGYYMSKPNRLFKIIGQICSEGRWSYSSSRSSRVPGTLVKGPVLALIWIGEFALICIPAIGVAMKRAKRPFIEFEDDWADFYSGNSLIFGGELQSLEIGKAELKYNPELLFKVQSLNGETTGSVYNKVDFYHSSGFEENYLVVKKMMLNQKKRTYIPTIIAENIEVDKEFLYRLFKHCGGVVPFDSSEFELEDESSELNDIVEAEVEAEGD